MAKILSFLVIAILFIYIGSYGMDTPEFNAVQTNQNDLINTTKEMSNADTDLVIFNGSTLTPEISVPYLGGIINAIWYPIKITLEIIILILCYFNALIGISNMLPVELAPFVLIGILVIIFMLIRFVANLGRD